MADEYFNIFKHVQKISLAAVESPDEAYVLRKITRLFSKTFNVSIMEAEKLPLVYMLQHIYENRFEEMTSDEKANTAEMLLKGKENVQQDPELQTAIEDDEWLAKLEEELKAEVDKDTPKVAPEALPNDVKMDFE